MRNESAENMVLRHYRPGHALARLPWEHLDRGDWALSAAAHAGVDPKLIVKAACSCASLALSLIPAGEDRPAKAIAAAESWTRDEATRAQVLDAAEASEAATQHFLSQARALSGEESWRAHAAALACQAAAHAALTVSPAFPSSAAQACDLAAGAFASLADDHDRHPDRMHQSEASHEAFMAKVQAMLPLVHAAIPTSAIEQALVQRRVARGEAPVPAPRRSRGAAA